MHLPSRRQLSRGGGGVEEDRGQTKKEGKERGGRNNLMGGRRDGWSEERDR